MEAFQQAKEIISSATFGVTIGVGFGIWALSLFALGVYRLYFHPLAKFPGPKLAALTLWYETYHDVWCRGKYVFEIKEMHKKYGRLSIAPGNST